MVKQIEILYNIAAVSMVPPSILGIALIAWISCNHSNKPLESTGKWTVAAIILLVATCVLGGWFLITTDNINHIILASIFPVTWQCGLISIYILCIKRLRITFSGTKYDSPNKIYIAMYCACGIFGLCLIAQRISYTIHLCGMMSEMWYDFVTFVVIIVEEVVDVVLSISLVGLFIRKLRQLTLDINLKASCDDVELDDMQSVQNSLLSAKQLKIITSMSKLTILSSIIIISTECYFLYLGIVYWLGVPQKLNAIRWMCFSLNVMVNSICLVLNFDFAETLYNRLCCHFHYCCRKICAYQTKRQQNVLAKKLLQTI
eukprot:174710_1